MSDVYFFKAIQNEFFKKLLDLADLIIGKFSVLLFSGDRVVEWVGGDGRL